MSLRGRARRIRRNHVLFTVIGFGFAFFIVSHLFATGLQDTTVTLPKPKHSIISLDKAQETEQLNKKTTRVRFPCLGPWCGIDCLDLYGATQKKDLSPAERIHIAIDLGLDSETNYLISQYPPPKVCTYRKSDLSHNQHHSKFTVNYFPLAFGFIERYLLGTVPRSVHFHGKYQIVNQTCIPKKENDFSKLISGDLTTYEFAFGDESEYRRQYMNSFFAVTKKKGGWDCNRHYEIIASGAMPYFEDLNQSGSFMLIHLPKLLLNEVQSMQGIDSANLKLNHTAFNFTHYFILLHRLVYYSHYRLTTRKLTKYILKMINYSHKQDALTTTAVLYISHNSCDYMKDLMLHGFTLVFEDNLHVFDAPQFMYEYSSKKRWTLSETRKYYGEPLYGLGFGYALSLQDYKHLYRRDKIELPNERIVKANIQHRRYSLVVFGSIIRQNRLFDFVTKFYKQSEIVVIDGEDEMKHGYRAQYARQAMYFLREIPDDCNAFS